MQHSGGIQVKKILEDMIIKWHQAGYALAEIAALIRQHDKETRL